MIIDGLFYTYYWNRCKNGDADVAILSAILAIAAPTLPYIGIIFTLLDTVNIKLQSELLLYIYIALTGITAIRYLWHWKYKEIIKQHDKYDQKLYKNLAILWGIVSILAAFVWCYLAWYLNNFVNNVAR